VLACLDGYMNIAMEQVCFLYIICCGFNSLQERIQPLYKAHFLCRKQVHKRKLGCARTRSHLVHLRHPRTDARHLNFPHFFIFSRYAAAAAVNKKVFSFVRNVEPTLRCLVQTEEYVNGQLKNKYGDAFIRGNNVLYISTVPAKKK
jgi:hypothetical protein